MNSAHSAGAKLIHEASKKVAADKLKKRPFIHLTFLDAYTSDDGDTNSYGNLGNYPHYSEHYVDMGLWYTDALLPTAFNFDITGWTDDANRIDPTGLPTGHHWPWRWYTRSVESPTSTGDLGFMLSLEGGNEGYSTLSQRFQPGKSC
jgi:hypothetical protein